MSLTPVICGHASDLLTVFYRVHDTQIAAIGFNWAHETFEGSPLHGWYCCCSDLNVCIWSIRHAPQPGHSLTGHPYQYWSSLPCNTTENCSWPDWPPINNLQHPAWPWSRHWSGDCCLCRCQKSIHRGIHGISWLQPNWGWEIPAYGQGSEIQPLSDSYLHRQWQHLYHHCESGRAQPPNQTPKHQYGV